MPGTKKMAPTEIDYRISSDSSPINERFGYVYIGDTRMGFSGWEADPTGSTPIGATYVWFARNWPNPTPREVTSVLHALDAAGHNVGHLR